MAWTWRTPATALAVVALPSALLAAALGAGFAAILIQTVRARFSLLYSVALSCYALHVAQTLGASLLGIYLNQRLAAAMKDALTPSADAAYVVFSTGSASWQPWAFPLVSALVSLTVWACLRAETRP